MNMSSKDLVKYLKIILMLEKERRVACESKIRISQQIERLGISTVSEPEPLDLKYYKKHLLSEIIVGTFFISISSYIFYISFCISDHWHVFYIIKDLVSGTVGAIGLIGFCISLFFTGWVIKGTIEDKKFDIAEYNREMTAYNVDKVRLKKENRTIYELNRSIKILDKQYKAVNEVLDRYYDFIDINKEYKGLIPISMFIHYLECDICSELGGKDGCYSRYRYELMLGIIIDKLDIIINKLDEMKKTMDLLVQVIDKSNTEIQFLCDKAMELSEQNERIEKFQRESNILIREAMEELESLKR